MSLAGGLRRLPALHSHAFNSQGLANILGIDLIPRLSLRNGAVKQISTGSTRKTLRFRKFLFFVPLAGGAAFLILSPRNEPTVPTILSNPTIIPCSSSSRSNLFTHQLSSPLEDHPSILRIILRFLACLFAPVLLTSPMLLVGSPKNGERWGAVWWYGYLVAQMQRAGPTFIKLAQWAGSRADLFPAELCDRLGALHSNGRPHSFQHTKRVIERAFKRPFSQVFEDFDETPIGIGAIAQVYRAKLNPELIPNSYLHPKHTHPGKRRSPAALIDGSDAHPPVVPTSVVAIKILHPRVASTIRRDLAIMTFFAKIMTWLPGMEWLSLPEEVCVFGNMMNEQLDLRNEAVNLRTFEKNFARRRGAVTFPRPLEDFSSAEVLVEEFQDALPLKYFLRNGGGPFDDRLANLGLDAFLNMLLLDNFVHSDLHPGNIMVKFYKPTTRFVLQSIISSIFNTTPPTDNLSPSDTSPPSNDGTPTPAEESHNIVTHLRELAHDPEAWLETLDNLAAEGYQPSLVLIDTGLVTTLNAENRTNFLDLFRAISEFDGYRAGKLMVERSHTPELAVDPETFALKIQHLVLGVKSKTFSLAQIKISDILTELLKNVRKHHVKMEGDFVNTVIAILLLEGIGRRLDPDMDLFKSSLPILRQLGRQVTAKDAMEEIPRGNLGAMIKIWVWIEARELVSTAIVNVDEMIHYDWLSPNI